MRYYKNSKKYWLIVTIVLMTLFIYTPSASADIGPKPSLDIIVVGMDTDDYWLDLLVTDDSNYSWLEITEEERAKVSKLADYQDDDGFHPALLGGTNVPLNGTLVGEKQPDGSYLHKFSYLGVPKSFKIAIVKKDGTLIISDIVTRKQFQSIMVFDLQDLKVTENEVILANKVSEKIPWITISMGFIVRLMATLVIEIGIALLFGFTLKNSFKILLTTNLITQIILNIIILFGSNIYGLLAGILLFILVETLIVIIEALVYSKFLTEKNKLRRIIYAIFANIISTIAGFMLFFIP